MAPSPTPRENIVLISPQRALYSSPRLVISSLLSFIVGPYNRPMASLLGSLNRSWEFKFVSKDIPCSEFNAHHTAERTLDTLRHKLGNRIVNRGNPVLFMGEDERDQNLQLLNDLYLLTVKFSWYFNIWQYTILPICNTIPVSMCTPIYCSAIRYLYIECIATSLSRFIEFM